jgi:hypothetical protein
VVQSGASLSGVDADFNRGISANIINDINRAKKGDGKGVIENRVISKRVIKRGDGKL